MEYFKNKSESFFREVRSIEIYKSSDISFDDNSKGIYPQAQQPLYKFDIPSDTFSRKLLTKTRSGNYFYDIDLGFPLLDLDPDVIEKCYEYFNRKGFAVVFITNVEKLLLGNDHEEITVEFIDGKKDDASGTDECNFSITGKTIIPPKYKKL